MVISAVPNSPGKRLFNLFIMFIRYLTYSLFITLSGLLTYTSKEWLGLWRGFGVQGWGFPVPWQINCGGFGLFDFNFHPFLAKCISTQSSINALLDTSIYFLIFIVLYKLLTFKH